MCAHPLQALDTAEDTLGSARDKIKGVSVKSSMDSLFGAALQACYPPRLTRRAATHVMAFCDKQDVAVSSQPVLQRLLEVHWQ